MKVEYSRTFAKDLEQIRNAKVLRRIHLALDETRRARDLSEVRSIKRMVGARSFYRIRLGNLRLGFEMIESTARILRCLDRKDIYRNFP